MEEQYRAIGIEENTKQMAPYKTNAFYKKINELFRLSIRKLSMNQYTIIYLLFLLQISFAHISI